MERYTRKDAEACFERLLKVTGHRHADSWNDVGGWQLDYAGCYGGYVVEEICTPGGGVRHPLGDRRRTAREFCEAVWFAERAIEARL